MVQAVALLLLEGAMVYWVEGALFLGMVAIYAKDVGLVVRKVLQKKKGAA